jgi:hypothetical protein
MLRAVVGDNIARRIELGDELAAQLGMEFPWLTQAKTIEELRPWLDVMRGLWGMESMRSLLAKDPASQDEPGRLVMRIDAVYHGRAPVSELIDHESLWALFHAGATVWSMGRRRSIVSGVVSQCARASSADAIPNERVRVLLSDLWQAVVDQTAASLFTPPMPCRLLNDFFLPPSPEDISSCPDIGALSSEQWAATGLLLALGTVGLRGPYVNDEESGKSVGLKELLASLGATGIDLPREAEERSRQVLDACNDSRYASHANKPGTRLPRSPGVAARMEWREILLDSAGSLEREPQTVRRNASQAAAWLRNRTRRWPV